jgi:large subunit ribosomal protein L2
MTTVRIKNKNELIFSYPTIKPLLKINPRGGGRNNHGSIIFRRSGGGFKRFFKFIDFKKIVWNLPFYILHTEKDSFRTGFIFLVCFVNGILSYILATDGVEKNNSILTTDKSGFFFTGNTLVLKRIPEGAFINSLEKRYLFGGTIARAAGTSAIILKKFSMNQILIRLPSKEEILIGNKTIATIGRVSNINHRFIKICSAGRSRRLGIKPVVRGVARNPIDHPHGGSGGRPQVTFCSKIAKNKSTRKTKLFFNSFIFLSRRKLKK